VPELVVPELVVPELVVPELVVPARCALEFGRNARIRTANLRPDFCRSR